MRVDTIPVQRGRPLRPVQPVQLHPKLPCSLSPLARPPAVWFTMSNRVRSDATHGLIVACEFGDATEWASLGTPKCEGTPMRLTDDRYSQERRQLEVALRM